MTKTATVPRFVPRTDVLSTPSESLSERPTPGTFTRGRRLGLSEPELTDDQLREISRSVSVYYQTVILPRRSIR